MKEGEVGTEAASRKAKQGEVRQSRGLPMIL